MDGYINQVSPSHGAGKNIGDPNKKAGKTDRCHISNKHSFVEIFNNSLSLSCSDEETIDLRLMNCINDKYVKNLQFIVCDLSKFIVKRFASDYAIEKIVIKYTLKFEHDDLSLNSDTRRFYNDKKTFNFESASFVNMSSLKYLEIKNVRTFEIFNLSFHGDFSLISLKIRNYNFTLFQHRPFEQLKNLFELRVNFGTLKALPEELFYGLYNLKTLDLRVNLIEFVHLLAFRHLSLLEQLNLEENPITSLAEDLLKGLWNLTILAISGKFSELRSVFLKELDNLTEFRASYFPLLRIEEDFFSHSINLRKVAFDHNDVLHLPSNLLKNK
ncbi:leucine-rich repeat and immunoglobulin-like domain-containing nogo receptor-interacting protein 1 [Centruroides vittatus]|uniref:leucine-rich repeat and immunoglobulin-like domain-containing nogo receptor-interacting protein 1 n=1 Tax=Centruroides vittatus TaxID=120091 RepID=UPI00351023CC